MRQIAARPSQGPALECAIRTIDRSKTMPSHSNIPAASALGAAAATAHTAGHENLRRLQWLRDFAIAALALLTALAEPLFHTLLPLAPIVILLGLWAVVSIVTWVRLRHAAAVSDRELLAQLGIDVVILTVLLALSGGPANPLTALYLPSVAVAAAALRARHAWIVALASVVAYSLLWKFSLPLTVEDVDRAMQMHLMGMWLIFAAAAILIAGFVAHITAALRERERQLAAAREQALRDERIVALGNLAAGAAHELGTPLATMAVLNGELLNDPATPPMLRADLELLGTQIQACKHIISGLSRHAGITRPEGGSAIRVDRWLEQLVARWRSLRPQVVVQLDLDADHQPAAPLIFAETTLEQALLNLFNNAADANATVENPAAVEIQVRWSADTLEMDILDRGPGIDPALLQRAGHEFFSTRADGVGIGLFLAHAAFERHGGHISMSQREGGGTRTRVMLPLQNLNAARENPC